MSEVSREEKKRLSSNFIQRPWIHVDSYGDTRGYYKKKIFTTLETGASFKSWKKHKKKN